MRSATDPSARFHELCELEPRLCGLEEHARAERDDGSRSFYCSNFVWLPLYMRLRDLLGTYRLAPAQEDRTGPLFSSDEFETAFAFLSPLLPACRDCGCRVFEPVREEQLRRK